MNRLLLALLLLGCARPELPEPPAPLVAETDSAYVLLAPRRIIPTPLHLAVLEMLHRCAGKPVPTAFRVEVADSIIGLPTGRLSYGLTGPVENGVLVVLETAFVHHAGVVSHELLHAAWRAPEDAAVMARCTMSVGTGLPFRRVSDPYAYVERGHVLGVGP